MGTGHRKQLHRRRARQHDGKGIELPIFDSLPNAGLVPHAVGKGDDGGNGVPQAKGRKQDELLNLVIQSVGGHQGLPHRHQNDVQAVGHNRHQRLGDNGRQADGVDPRMIVPFGL